MTPYIIKNGIRIFIELKMGALYTNPWVALLWDRRLIRDV
jgi:hypothetical protein